MSLFHVIASSALVGAALLAPAQESEAGQAPPQPRTGRQVYEQVCIACHGPDGRAGVNLELEKIKKPPDFTDCSFANREPDRGFVAVAHNGGPARGFSALMAPWGGTFSEEEIGLAVSHIRTFCKDDRWPRGELNLPLALVTGKAFPEDEAVMKVTTKSGSVVTKVVYERRFGPLNQWEIALPITSVDPEDSGAATGVGDIALGYKRTLAHSLPRGNIFSVSTEVILPTGSEDKDLGGGVAVFEPFVTFGQLLPHNAFIQAQAGFGIPMTSGDGHDNEAFWRVAVGQSFEQGRFGRYWSPMLEILAARSLVDNATTEWDLLPGMQVTLNTRQHVRVAGGVRFPVNDADVRGKSVIFYLLWDWFEGGFFQGW
jgi:mono/diheme cytochrome c family protein